MICILSPWRSHPDASTTKTFPPTLNLTALRSRIQSCEPWCSTTNAWRSCSTKKSLMDSFKSSKACFFFFQKPTQNLFFFFFFFFVADTWTFCGSNSSELKPGSRRTDSKRSICPATIDKCVLLANLEYSSSSDCSSVRPLESSSLTNLIERERKEKKRKKKKKQKKKKKKKKKIYETNECALLCSTNCHNKVSSIDSASFRGEFQH